MERNLEQNLYVNVILLGYLVAFGMFQMVLFMRNLWTDNDPWMAAFALGVYIFVVFLIWFCLHNIKEVFEIDRLNTLHLLLGAKKENIVNVSRRE